MACCSIHCLGCRFGGGFLGHRICARILDGDRGVPGSWHRLRCSAGCDSAALSIRPVVFLEREGGGRHPRGRRSTVPLAYGPESPHAA
jgi:hypothetical protein